MITISYPDLALLGGLDLVPGEVRDVQMSVFQKGTFLLL